MEWWCGSSREGEDDGSAGGGGALPPGESSALGAVVFDGCVGRGASLFVLLCLIEV